MDIKYAKVESKGYGLINKKEGFIEEFKNDRIIVNYNGITLRYTTKSFIDQIEKKMIIVEPLVYDYIKKLCPAQEHSPEKKVDVKKHPTSSPQNNHISTSTPHFGCNFYFVFQGIECEKEFRDGYLFAGNDETIHHWARMNQLRVGDIVLHGSSQAILAISVITKACYNGTRDGEHTIGKRADCRYYILNEALTLFDKREKLADLSIGKYQPFNKNGTGNQGYLFDMNDGLRDYLLDELKKANRNCLENALEFSSAKRIDFLLETKTNLQYKNSFIFKYEDVEYQGISGYAVYSIKKEKLGLFWRHYQKKGEMAEGQAEILFFDEYRPLFNKWRRIFQDTKRIMFEDIVRKLKVQRAILMTIDEQKSI